MASLVLVLELRHRFTVDFFDNRREIFVPHLCLGLHGTDLAGLYQLGSGHYGYSQIKLIPDKTG